MLRCLLLVLLLAVASLQAVQDVWTDVKRIVAVGDVHGEFEQFAAVLRFAGMIDAKGNWSGGQTHLVQTGDVLDRGPDSRKAMDLLMKLERQAEQAGGRVHALIGNHETMNIYGDLHDTSPGEFAAFRDQNSVKLRQQYYKQHVDEIQKAPPPSGLPAFDDDYRKRWESQFPLGYFEHRQQLGPDGTYGKWIRSHNAVIKINDMVFLHGGISPRYVATPISEINRRVLAELEDPSKLQGSILVDEEGPLWYRGLAQGDQRALAPQVETVLRNLGAARIVIGHTPVAGAVLPRFGGKVILIDVGMSRFYFGAQACLLVENGKPYALHRGRRLDLPSDFGKDLLRYVRQAAALDPPPSPLGNAITYLEEGLAKRVAPVEKQRK